MSTESKVSATEALERLKDGNRKYLNAVMNDADISPRVRVRTYEEGQSPYAVIVACSDSRVIPESIFSCGIGEIFVIRIAGNVVGDHELGSIEYAAEHLGCHLVVVLGHTGCGAVKAAIEGDPGGFVGTITDEIREAIGEERDEHKAVRLNVGRSVKRIRESLLVPDNIGEFKIIGAIYHTDTGLVKFLEEK